MDDQARSVAEHQAVRTQDSALAGQFVAFVGKLGGMPRKEAAPLIREYGGTPVDSRDPRSTLVIVGADELPLADLDAVLSEALRERVDRRECQVINETELWERLGLLDPNLTRRRLYTPAMLADLLGVTVASIRRWHRRGLIVPAQEVRRLPYFDFQEVATARQIARLIAAGNSPKSIETKLAKLAEVLPSRTRPLDQLSVIVEGRDIFLRQQEGLIDAGGQRRFDFEAFEDQPAASDSKRIVQFPGTDPPIDEASREESQLSPEELQRLAALQEEQGRLPDAVDTLRTLLMATTPKAELSFQLAELLYRLGDLHAARERYFIAIELDEDYVEARANLGCLLAEMGEAELAVAAFRGALRFHEEFPDVYFHLGRTLDEIGSVEEANDAWTRFLELAPDSPWSDEARLRLGIESTKPWSDDDDDYSSASLLDCDEFRSLEKDVEFPTDESWQSEPDATGPELDF